MEDRIDYIIGKMKTFMLGVKIDRDYILKGTSIARLCEFDGPPYRRIKSWVEKKALEADGEVDMAAVKWQFDRCYELMCGRNKSYGASWKVLSPQSIANLIEMKMNRIAQLGEVDTKTIDEFTDVINYAVFALIKLKEKK